MKHVYMKVKDRLWWVPMVLGMIIWAVVLTMFVVSLSSCGTSKKAMELTVTQKDSTSTTQVKSDSTGKSETATISENTTTTEFTEFFMTDADSGEAYLELDTTETETFETGGIKIEATKDKKGGIKLKYTDKPKKAYGKGKTTSQTKEQSTTKSEAKVKADVKQNTQVSTEEKKKVKAKEVERIPAWVWWLVALIALYLIWRFVIKRYLKR